MNAQTAPQLPKAESIMWLTRENGQFTIIYAVAYQDSWNQSTLPSGRNTMRRAATVTITKTRQEGISTDCAETFKQWLNELGIKPDQNKMTVREVAQIDGKPKATSWICRPIAA